MVMYYGMFLSSFFFSSYIFNFLFFFNSISLSPDNNYFVSGSVDQTSRLYDLRTNDLAQMRFVDHTNDVNAVWFVQLFFY